MKNGILLAATIAGLCGASPSDAGVFRVDVHEGTIDLTGSITTDSTIGVLSGDNIKAFDIVANAPGFSVDFSSAASTLFVLGNDLVSTGTALTFDYGSDDGGAFGFIVEPARTSVLCNGAPNQDQCGLGITILGPAGESAFESVTDKIVIATAPEPSTWALLAIGFAALGLMSRRGKALWAA